MYQFTKQVKRTYGVTLRVGGADDCKRQRELLGVGSIWFRDVGAGSRGAPCVQILLTINLRFAYF